VRAFLPSGVRFYFRSFWSSFVRGEGGPFSLRRLFCPVRLVLNSPLFWTVTPPAFSKTDVRGIWRVLLFGLFCCRSSICLPDPRQTTIFFRMSSRFSGDMYLTFSLTLASARLGA